MIVELDILLFLILLVTAVAALWVRDLLAAVAVLAAYSMFVSLLFTGLGAVDVALVEAVLGAGFVGLLFVATVLATGRRQDSAPAGKRWVVPTIAVFVALMVYASVDLPDRGDPDAPASTHVSPTYIEESMPAMQTPNVVTAVLADFRSHDTFGETLVIFTAGLACALILARRADAGEDDGTLPRDERGRA